MFKDREFDYNSDDDDLNWEEADGFPEVGLPPMPVAFPKEFFNYGIPFLAGMFPETLLGHEAASMFGSSDEFLGLKRPRCLVLRMGSWVIMGRSSLGPSEGIGAMDELVWTARDSKGFSDNYSSTL